MEVDYATHPSMVASAHAGDAAVTIPMAGVMSLDDFLSANQEDHDAFLAARKEANRPAKKSKTKSSTPVQPVAVGARSSKHTILLHEQYQALAIPQPVFTYQGDGVTKFSVEVSFPGLANAEELQGLKEEGRFNSKQEAKEAASKSALAILERLVEEGRITKAGKAKKPKGEPAQQQPKEEDPWENFVGQLLGTYDTLLQISSLTYLHRVPARDRCASAKLHRLPARHTLGLSSRDRGPRPTLRFSRSPLRLQEGRAPTRRWLRGRPLQSRRYLA
jgi:hypothetical protein